MRTGGNDNAVRVWSASKLGAGAQELQGHGAAVKALAWSPHARGRLATGGGTADRSIKIWDAARGLRLSTVDTGSQVCALAWSSAEDALVSAHGYSLNQILIWRLPELARDGVLAGHGKRVLYLALSPDSRVAVTGAGDESLRFWACFGRRRSGPGGLLECGGIR
jgi:cell division cycle 20-like protein 1 (cofactor of APC complex)